MRAIGQETSIAVPTLPVRPGRSADSRDRALGDAVRSGGQDEWAADGGGGEEGVIVTLSPAAREKVAAERTDPIFKRSAEARTQAGEPLTKQELRHVEQLQARDAEVRAHEAAHASASGGLGGAPSFDYAVGPDGRRYAVGGEVSVDTSGGRTPEETIAKARTIRAAATAPADPSAQDMAVAASAARMEAEAHRALRDQRRAESEAVERATETAPAARDTQPAESTATAASAAEASSEATAPKSAPPNPLWDPAAASQEHSAEMVLATLVREQNAVRGGSGHTHLETSCGFCRKAVSRYG